ncbi:MAG: GNAT family N-acetyltransferase [Candidatus Nanopelagicales bacterium]
MQVRRATAADVPVIVQYIHELAEYEREPEAVQITSEQLQDALFRDEPHLFAHVTEIDGEVVGMAIWFLNFSTWEGTHGIYVEDLYVTPDARGRGAGRGLLAAVAGECLRRGFARLELAVLDWNLPAIAFYRSIGAVGMDEWTVQRVSGDALTALGGAGSS